AVGVVLYEMLEGHRPFEGANVNAVLASIRRGAGPKTLELSPGVPASIAAVICRCLSRTREGRYRDGEELAQALASAMAAADRARLPALGLRRGVWLGLGLAVACAACVAFVALRPRPAPPTAGPNVGNAGMSGSTDAAAGSAGPVEAPPS